MSRVGASVQQRRPETRYVVEEIAALYLAWCDETSEGSTLLGLFASEADAKRCAERQVGSERLTCTVEQWKLGATVRSAWWRRERGQGMPWVELTR